MVGLWIAQGFLSAEIQLGQEAHQKEAYSGFVWNSFVPLVYLSCQHRAVLHVVSAHLGSRPRPSAPVTALSLMPTANMFYGKGVGAARQRTSSIPLGMLTALEFWVQSGMGAPFLTLP